MKFHTATRNEPGRSAGDSLEPRYFRGIERIVPDDQKLGGTNWDLT
jgi:hypothetical protein